MRRDDQLLPGLQGFPLPAGAVGLLPSQPQEAPPAHSPKSLQGTQAALKQLPLGSLLPHHQMQRSIAEQAKKIKDRKTLQEEYTMLKENRIKD